MATFFPLVLKPVNLDGKVEASPRTGNAYFLYKIINLIGFSLFVNPTTIKISKKSKISTIRALDGYKIVPWYNDPDTISFDGIIYGSVRAILDMAVIANLSSMNAESKMVRVYYKWRGFNAYLDRLEFDASVEKPNVLSYKIDLICEEAFNLYSLLIGNIQPIQVDTSFLAGQADAVADVLQSSVKSVAGASFFALNVGAMATLGGGNISKKDLFKTLALRSAFLLGGKVISKRKL